jgi:iron complex outermembrane receptor protein
MMLFLLVVGVRIVAAGENDAGPFELATPEPFAGPALAQSDAESSDNAGPEPGSLEEFGSDLPDDLAPDADEGENTFADMEIEQLMEVRVTSVAGMEKDWFRTPAAVSVITYEDIRDGGHRFLPEALRLVPGMNVGRINASTWAVSARGFNGRFSNKLQVLIDGRVAYDPLFSGVFWDIQDVYTPDLDRIEVIRGPGATLWGANAVNGVINVTTKSAKETQGLHSTGGGGDELQGFGGARYGGRIGEDTYVRVYGKYHNHEGFVGADGEERPDDWDMARGGFRLDHEGADHATITLQGDVYGSGRIGEGTRTANPSGHFAFDTHHTDGRASGGNIMLRIDRDDPEDESGWELKTYYDRRNRVIANGFQSERDIFEADFRHHFRPLSRHELMWGAAFRYTHDRTEGTDTLRFDPPSRSLRKPSAFVQDTITLVPDTLLTMVGSKFEHNDYTGFEFQPSARLWWTPDGRQTLWGAISRPVRTPSRINTDLRFTRAYADSGLLGGGPPSGNTVPLMIRGNKEAEAERLRSYETGYRIEPIEGLMLDTAGFYNEYRDLLSPGRRNIGTFKNAGTGESYGVETSVRWDPAENLRIQGSYSVLRVPVHGRDMDTDAEGTSPEHRFQLRSTLDVVEDLSLHGALYYNDNLPARDIPAYIRMDLGLTWRPTENTELSVWGQNLLDPSHPEYRDPFLQDRITEIERSVYIQASLNF